MNNVMTNKDRICLTMQMTFIVGFIAYGFMYANVMFTHDAATLFYSDQTIGFISGKWFLDVIMQGVNLGFQLPWLNGIYSLAILGVTFYYMSKILNINSRIGIASLIGVVTIFPTILQCQIYVSSIDVYMTAFLMSVLAAYCVSKELNWWRVLLSALFMAFSIATYQAYVGITLCLMLNVMINKIFDGDSPYNIIKRAFCYLGSIVGCGVIYLVANKVILAMNNATIQSYQGQDKLGQFESIGQIVELVKLAYGKVYSYYWSYGTYGFVPVPVVNAQRVLIVLSVVFLIILFIKKRIYKNVLNTLFLFIIISLMPLAMGFLTVANPYLSFDSILYRMPYVYFFILFIYLVEEICKEFVEFKIKSVNIFRIIATVLVIFIVFRGVTLCNVAGFKLKMDYDRSISMGTQLVTEVQMVEGYTTEVPIQIIGNFDTSKFYYSRGEGFDALLSGMIGYGYWNSFTYSSVIPGFLMCEIGFKGNIIGTSPWNDEIALKTEVREMPCWPDDGSIKMVDGEIVIKLSEIVQ